MAFNWEEFEIEQPEQTKTSNFDWNSFEVEQPKTNGFDWNKFETEKTVAQKDVSTNKGMTSQPKIYPTSVQPQFNQEQQLDESMLVAKPDGYVTAKNGIVSGGIKSTQQKKTPFRDFGRTVGRALLPKNVENNIYGTQEDEALIREGRDNIMTFDDALALYKDGALSKEEFEQASQKDLAYRNALIDKDFREWRNKEFGKAVLDIGTAALPIGLAGQFVKGAVALGKGARAASIAKKLNDAQKLKYGKYIDKLAEKQLARNWGVKTGAMIADGATVGAGYGLADYGLGELTGNKDPNMTWQQSVLNGAGAGAILGTGFAGLGRLAQTQPVKNAVKKVVDKISENQHAAKFLSDAGSFLGQDVGQIFKNKTLQNYDGLNERVAKVATSADDLITDEQLKVIEDSVADNMGYVKHKWDEGLITNDKEYGQNYRKIKAGIDPNAPEVKEPEVKNWEINKLDHYTKEQADAANGIFPVEDLKGKYEIPTQQNTVSEDNYFKKQKHVEGDLSYVKPEEDKLIPEAVETPVKTQNNIPQDDIVRKSYGGKVRVSKNGKEWFSYSKKKKLPAGEAEGSDSSHLYQQKVASNAEEVAPNNDLAPSDDASLLKEIEEAQKLKQVPKVNVDYDRQKTTPAQRMALRLANDRAQQSWNNKIKNTKVKALNSDLDSDAKSLSKIIYEHDYKATEPSHYDVRQVNPEAKVKAPENRYDEHGNLKKPDKNTLFSRKFGKVALDKNNFIQTRAKTEVSTIGKCIKGEGKIEEVLQSVGDVKVVLSKYSRTDGTQGLYHKDSNTIYIYGNCKEPIKTLLHESRHALQEKIANLSSRKLDRKIVNAGYERGKRLSDYMKKNQKVLDKIAPDMVDYKNGVISKEALYSKLSRQERKVFEEYDRLYEKYYRTYIERDARAFSEGNTDKLLFGKTSDEVARLAGTNSNETSRNIVQQGNNSRNNKLWGHRLNNPSGKSYEIERIEESIDGKPTNAGRNNKASGQLPRTSKLGTRTDGSTNTRETREVFYSTKDKEVYYTGVKLSKENEALKLKMGLIEQDEAFDNKVNRLASKIFKKPVVKLSPKEKKDAANIVMAMQCTKGSETNIYYRNPSKGNGKISLTQDYSKEGKEGLLWGHKKGEMYGQKDTQKIIHSLTQDNARLKATNDLTQYVVKTFGEKIEKNADGIPIIKNGYVPINSKLLNNAVYTKSSKQWYNLVNSGDKEAIKKAFNEDLAKDLIELYETSNTHDYQVPKAVFDRLFDGTGETLAESYKRYGFGRHNIGKTIEVGLNTFNGFFKRKVLGLSPSWFTNNRIGNYAMIGLKSENPVEFVKAFGKAFTIKDSDLPKGILDNNLLEAMKGYNARRTFTGNTGVDNFLNLISGQSFETKDLKGFKKAMAQTANILAVPNKIVNKICDKTMKFNQAFENFERKIVYAQQVDRIGKQLVKNVGQNIIKQKELMAYINNDPKLKEVVLNNVLETLGDYNIMTPFEKKYVKAVVPFYSWYRTITRHAVSEFKKNPTKMTMFALEMRKLKEDDKTHKEYQKGSIKLNAKNEKTGKQLVWNYNHANPMSTFLEASDEPTSMITPAITRPIEAARGKKFFQDSPITNDRYEPVKQWYGKDAGKNYYFDKKTQDFVKNKDGSYSTELPLAPRVGYVAKQTAADTIIPFANSSMINLDELSGYASDKHRMNDKSYDASFGGYHNKDYVGKYSTKSGKTKYVNRYAQEYPTDIKLLKKVIGGVQDETTLNKKELKEYREKAKRQRKRMLGYL